MYPWPETLDFFCLLEQHLKGGLSGGDADATYSMLVDSIRLSEELQAASLRHCVVALWCGEARQRLPGDLSGAVSWTHAAAKARAHALGGSVPSHDSGPHPMHTAPGDSSGFSEIDDLMGPPTMPSPQCSAR